jgi:hypothetical protein
MVIRTRIPEESVKLTQNHGRRNRVSKRSPAGGSRERVGYRIAPLLLERAQLAFGASDQF